MLTRLSIRDVVIIDRLDLDFEKGLCVLTGETGAGKSILLDALGLVLGARGDSSLVRYNAEKAVVSASFLPDAAGAAASLLAENGIEMEGEIVVRRIQSASGTSKALVNDQPVSVSFLKKLGSLLCEVHGQHETRALVDASVHRSLLDGFAGSNNACRNVASAWEQLREIREKLVAHRTKLERAAAEQAFLVHALEELNSLSPKEGEEDELAEKRQIMMQAGQFGDALEDAAKALSGEKSLEGELNSALRKLEMRRDAAGGRLDDACDALERVVVEISEARNVIDTSVRAFEFNPGDLERCEERLFALRAMARKHKVQVDDLAGLTARLQQDLDGIEDGDRRLAELEKEEVAASAAYLDVARELSASRHEAAKRLDEAVMAELAPLRLEKARFETRVETDEEFAGPSGIDRVEFLVSTNPGTPLASLVKVASGGELSRFMLALKVVLAATSSAPVLIFDEIDTGVGGAVADAIGQRLSRLSDNLQVLTISHSPQVASRADDHLTIFKISRVDEDDERAVTRVTRVSGEARREEIARMLSGARITDEARAQADRLLAEVG